MSLVFSSKLAKKYKDNLEELLFFNPQQTKIRSKLVEIIEKYGVPVMVVDGDSISVAIEGLEGVQTLFAFWKEIGRPELIGAMIYVRISLDTLLVLHMGVAEEFSSYAKKIKGISIIEVLYGQGEIQKIKI
jgi:hypothetical protein